MDSNPLATPAVPVPTRLPRPSTYRGQSSLPSQLDLEWRQLCAAPDAPVLLQRWAHSQPVLGGFGSLEQLLVAITRDPARRDGVLVALLTLSRDGDRLAGRVVLQAMLGKAIRVATTIVRRPDVLGDREEAQATAIGAMWQAIATYPLQARPSRVTANLALDTLALVQRGHTGSSHFSRTFPERPCADLTDRLDAAHYDVGPDDLAGPADAELIVLLAWSVRNGVLQLDEARLLARVYGLDGTPEGGATIAADLGLTWPTLRQRCHRLARRVGQAAIAAGLTRAGDRRGSAVLAAA